SSVFFSLLTGSIMSERLGPQNNRRDFMKVAGAASALTAFAVPHVHAEEKEIDTIQVALVGCGGRGSGAAADALNVPNARTKLVAMADVFEHRLTGSH